MPHVEIHIQLAVNYADDPKVAALARFGKHARPARDLYVQMVCYAKGLLTDGVVPAEAMGKLVYPDPPAIAAKQAAMLVEVGLIEPTANNGWLVLAFLKRNKSRADVEAGSASLAESGSEAGKYGNHMRWHVGQGKVDPTCVHCQTRSGSDRVDPIGPSRSKTETETETKTRSSKSPAPQRGTRLPDGWTPPATEVDWRRENGVPDQIAQRELPKFRDFWAAKSGRDATKVDWLATWRNWLRSTMEREPAAVRAATGARPARPIDTSDFASVR